MLDAVTRGEADGLGDISHKVEDSGRCVDVAHFYPLITSTRTARDIESAVRGRADYDNSLRQDLSSSAVESIAARQAELSEILSDFSVRFFYHTATMSTDSQLP